MTRISTKELNWAVGSHLAAFLILTGVPFGNILGPFLVWILKRDEFPLVNKNGKEALNFQLSITLYAILSALLIVLHIGIFLIIALALFDIIYVIVAAIKVNQKIDFHYPITMRFLR